MRKWTFVLLAVMLFLALAAPVWADDGEGQVVFPGSNVVVGAGEVLNHDVAVMGGNLEVREGGRILGDVAVMGGNADVSGEILGDLVVIGGTLTLQRSAVVDGNLVTFAATVQRAEGATIRGETMQGLGSRLPRLQPWLFLPRIPSTGRTWAQRTEPVFDMFTSFMGTVLNVLALMAIGVLLVLFLPKQTARVGRTVSQATLVSAGVGLLTLLVLLVLVPLLIIICIGIPVAVVLVLAAAAAGIFGYAAIGAVVGQRLFAAGHVARPQPLLEVIAGVAVIALLSAVPCVGWLLGAIVVAAGLGAVVLTRFGTMAYEPTTRVAPPPQAGPTAGSLPPQMPAAPDAGQQASPPAPPPPPSESSAGTAENPTN